jgi:hypothetical protein
MASPLESFEQAHEIGKEFKKIYDLLKKGTPDEYGLTPIKINYIEPDGTIKATLVDYFSQTFEGGSNNQEYYIRFGKFLSFLQQNIIPNINYDSTNKIIKIDNNRVGNIIYIQPYTFSVDPKVCYIKRDYLLGSFVPGAENFLVDFNGNTNIKGKYGNIMNIYFNMEWILGKIDEMKDNKGKISLYGLLDALCKGYNESTGNFNKLEPVIDTETNTIKILDDVALPDRNAILESSYITDVYKDISTEEVIFDTYKYNLGIKESIYGENVSHAGFIKDLSFTTTISPELATMITVGSTKQGYIKGADATSLSRMNNGLIDRFKEKITNADEIENEPPQPLNVQYTAAIVSFNTLITQLGTTPTKTLPIYDLNAIQDYKNLQTQIIEYYQYTEIEKNRSSNPNASSANSGFLPFDLSLKMDGLSGMKVYQKFIIDTDFLPTNYPGALEFLIKGITHTIAKNEWITSIESMAIPKNPFAVDSSIEAERNTNRERTQSFSAVRGSVIDFTLSAVNSSATLLFNAVRDQANYVLNTRLENLKECANYTYNIAYKIKEHIDNNSGTAITFNGSGNSGAANQGSGGNADSNIHRKAITDLGIYDEYYIGEYTPSSIRTWLSSQNFNYGDILNYYAPGRSGRSNMHSQIYTGNIFTSGKSSNGLAGNSGWTSSTKTNYGKSFVYNDNIVFKLYVYRIKEIYQK